MGEPGISPSDFRRATLPAVWIGVAVYAVTGLSDRLDQTFGYDSHAYWSAWRNGVYSGAPGDPDAYLYGPPFAQFWWPATYLPWQFAKWTWASLIAATFLWLLWPVGWRGIPPLLVLCSIEIVAGNVYAFMASACVLGVRRWPGAWALPLLLKVTPALGFVWFAVRREWYQLAVATAVTTVVVAISVAVSPGLWSEWFEFLLEHVTAADETIGETQGIPAPVYRWPVALGLVGWGAFRGKTWTLPVAMILASPVIATVTFTLMTALPRLMNEQRGGDFDSRGRLAWWGRCPVRST